MNQIDQLIENGAQYFTPARTVEIPGGESRTITFSGLSSRRYGVNRFIVAGTSMTKILATAKFNNGKDTKFENIQLAAIRNLFLNRSLRGAFTIDDSTEMYLTLTNTDSQAHTVNVQLVGYDDAHLQHKQEEYQNRGLPFPNPEFVFVSKEVAAGATAQRISVALPAYPLRLYRISVASDADNQLLMSFRQDQVRIKPEVFVSQINDEFQNMDIILPQNLQANVPFDLIVTNLDSANAHRFSFLAETYKI
ncbi:hypothetical protein [Rhodohalobacter barkolensis]|uniref:Uncharacterized protein n=1 Tax=Rhodohalobacter barkolensis TaxID=2053187 RepID=A0A2N0VHW0_9BACT|nr:hypothetical protein [Rhodohalobacter barkolensis]PKD43754.1 hypothetical protein CWD77_09350 [Rhodohalobacter barkolensis]